MPIQTCSIEGKTGYKWGTSGKCYVGKDAKIRALRQARAIEANRYTVNQRRLPRVTRANPLKYDPSRTTTLRRVYSEEMSKR